MHLHTIDWLIVFVLLVICFGPGLFFGKRSGKNTSEFFASGRSAPWWLAGLSMVATTFSSDTPNLVANFVRTQGVAANWSGVLTDLEFYELRHSGRAASAAEPFRPC
jgi:solute:Na+ symporter, SSS family